MIHSPVAQRQRQRSYKATIGGSSPSGTTFTTRRVREAFSSCEVKLASLADASDKTGDL